MKSKFPGAVTLGYAAIFISLWLFFMPVAGRFSLETAKVTVPILMVLGGVVLAIAGVFSFFNENKVDSIIFFIIAALNYSYSIRIKMMQDITTNSTYSSADGWIMVLIAVIIFYLWIASLKSNLIKHLFLLGLWIALLAGAIANWFSIAALLYLSGYLGLITSVLAGWYSGSTIFSIVYPEIWTKKKN
ncbi:MAG: GPR1/FUN34/YaaH family transporter [Ignavibacteriaceae bacterium]